MTNGAQLDRAMGRLAGLEPGREIGRVSRSLGILVEAGGPRVSVGDMCRIEGRDGWVAAQVVGFREGRILLMSLQPPHGLRPGARVESAGGPFLAPVGPGLLGRVVSGLGEPLDDRGP
ncbi:MAG: hypothetical protein GF355_18055, partial [Candidatus Eisenbacteria bacterium]|nr:hypothetical protein [Candidatus Eisenbacteria bacterium]